MSGVALPRAFCSVGDLEQIKARQTAVSSCSTSSAVSWSGRTTSSAFGRRLKQDFGDIRARHESDGRVSGLSFLGQFDVAGSFGEFSGHGRSTSSKERIEEPVCLMRGVNGGFWEGADSESKANNQSVSRKSTPRKEPSVLLSLIQEIQPLDVSQISKDASSDSTDAMKRTISGMLGLLPSDQFHVTVETSREPLARLLVSSMMTGYTLRNAEYRLCLQRSLELSEEDIREQDREFVLQEEEEEQDAEVRNVLESGSSKDEKWFTREALEAYPGEPVVMEDVNIPESLGPLTPEAEGYIRYLQHKLASVSKELEECKLSNTGLQMQNIVGEEKNDLLDYLRSLEPDKVAELSQPTSPEVEDVIQQVISGLLDNPSTKLVSKTPEFGTGTGSTISSSWEQEDGSDKFGTSSVQFQSTVPVNRDYLARLLFWCMLLGHHMRGLEYRLELSRTLSLSGDLELGVVEGRQEG